MGERPRLPSTRIGTLLFPDAILKAEFEANAPLRGNGYQGRSYLISLISHRASQCSSPRRPYVHATALASKGTRLTVHILAAVAEHEREMISERTKAALAAAKRRGQRLGKPNLTDVAKRGTATGKANARRFAANVRPIIDEIMRAGATSHNAIAAKLNERNVRTARGGKWTHVQVGAILHPFVASAGA